VIDQEYSETEKVELYRAWVNGQMDKAAEDPEFAKEVDEYDFYWGMERCECGNLVVLCASKKVAIQECGQCGIPVEIALIYLYD